MTDATLPSIAEILACTERLSRPDATNTVVKLREGVAVKYGSEVTSVEAENLYYVKSACDVPVPNVLGTLQEPDTGIYFIIMDFVPGQTLGSIMNQLTPLEKVHICRKIKAALDSLRQLPSTGYIGSLGRQPCYDGMFYTRGLDDRSMTGPFLSERDMKRGILKNIARFVPAAYLDLLAELFNLDADESKIYFTHGDLMPENIMVNRLHDQQGNTIDFDITIIDWECAGWYPEYWEFCNANIAALTQGQWLSIMCSILPTPVKEYPILEIIRDISFG